MVTGLMSQRHVYGMCHKQKHELRRFFRAFYFAATEFRLGGNDAQRRDRMIRFRKYLWCFTILFVFFFPTVAESAPPQAARIGGTVTVDGTALEQDADEGYTFEVTRYDGTSYDPAAEDTDGLNDSDWYLIDIPIYDEN